MINENALENLALEEDLKSDIRCLSSSLEERDFNIYIFICKFKDENDFLDKFKIINNSIAFNFQEIGRAHV